MRETDRFWGIPAIGALFAGFGIVSIVGGVYASSPRDVLLALGGTGLFAGVLFHLVTPRYFVRASIAERIHDVIVSNMEIFVPSVERQNAYTYVPFEDREPGGGSVLLSVSSGNDARDSELLVHTTGDALLAEFDEASVPPLSGTPVELGRQISDGLENGLELVETATCHVDSPDRRATVRVEGDVLGTAGRFDDPVTSFVGSAFAAGLGQPVTVEAREDGTGEIAISCQWEVTARLDAERHGKRDEAVAPSTDDS